MWQLRRERENCDRPNSPISPKIETRERRDWIRCGARLNNQFPFAAVPPPPDVPDRRSKFFAVRHPIVVVDGRMVGVSDQCLLAVIKLFVLGMGLLFLNAKEYEKEKRALAEGDEPNG